MDGGAWWAAAAHGLANSWTQLKRLSSSSIIIIILKRNDYLAPSIRTAITLERTGDSSSFSVTGMYTRIILFLLVPLLQGIVHGDICCIVNEETEAQKVH